MTRAFTLITITAIVAVNLITIFPANSNAARILGFFPSPTKSHLLIHCAIANTLAEAGHNVTVISSLPNVYKNAKYKFVHINVPLLDTTFVKDVIKNPKSIYHHMSDLIEQYTGVANNTLAHPRLQEFLENHDESSFELLLLSYQMIDFHFGIAAHFKCPIIVSFMIQPIFSINSMIGNPTEMSYVPALFSGIKQPMGFIDRIKSFLISMYEEYILDTWLKQHSEKYYEYHFPSDRYPALADIKKNISLIFTNHHFSQGPIRPNIPAIIEIGGIQIKEKPETLPNDIIQLLDNAKEGVILFSLGTVVQGSIISKEKAAIIFNVLSKLPHKVIWKWGDSDFPGQSKNIVYKTWLPQDEILTHPNVKLFITHGGLGSIVESQYRGVPMVGIPLFIDQPTNMVNVERAGFGLTVDFKSMTEESLRSAVLEVLQNPKYREAIKAFSFIYSDRPMTAHQTVKFWVEYVLRHKGAKHLQSPAVHMNRWQLLSLDVIGFLFVVVALVVICFVKLCKFVCSRSKKLVTKRKVRNVKKTTKKNK